MKHPLPSLQRRFLTAFAAAILAVAVSERPWPAGASTGSPSLAALAVLSTIPDRDPCSPTGSEVLARLASLSVEDRDREIVTQVLAGNIPGFLRQLRPVEMMLPGLAGVPVKATMWVMPDYLAIGSDQDFVRVPLGLDAAVRVAREFNCMLPTRKMVDAIHQHAEARLSPRPMPAGAAMTSVAYLLAHNLTIEQQLEGLEPGFLVAGNKKDVVWSRRLSERPGRVAIYGWHDREGRPIQPLSTVHGARYADYSHGIRLVSETVQVDGEHLSVFDVLEDQELAALLSDEGIDREARRMLGGESPSDPARVASLR